MGEIDLGAGEDGRQGVEVQVPAGRGGWAVGISRGG
jgi:hypothetical protein